MSDTHGVVETVPESNALVIVTVGLASFAVLVSLACMCGKQKRIDPQQILAEQEQNIFNISGRVPSSAPYPEGYLSVEHITISNELNKPPKYDDLPPSYDEAIKLAIAQSNSLQTLRVEQARVHEDPSSTSSSISTVEPARASQTTE